MRIKNNEASKVEFVWNIEKKPKRINSDHVGTNGEKKSLSEKRQTEMMMKRAKTGRKLTPFPIFMHLSSHVRKTRAGERMGGGRMK